MGENLSCSTPTIIGMTFIPVIPLRDMLTLIFAGSWPLLMSRRLVVKLFSFS